MSNSKSHMISTEANLITYLFFNILNSILFAKGKEYFHVAMPLLSFPKFYGIFSFGEVGVGV